MEHIKNIRPNTVIHILSDASDDVVLPEFGKAYTEQLIKNSKNAKFYLGINMEHNLSDKAMQGVISEGMNAFLKECSQNY
jgi:hypothetical protein